MNFLQKAGRGIVSFFAAAGLFTLRFISLILLTIKKIAGFLFLELKELVSLIARGIKYAAKSISSSFKERIKLSDELNKNIRRAKKEGGREHREAILNYIYTYFLAEGGVFYTAFNYIMPIISAAFLIGMIRYGSGLEYGIAVEYNGKEIGIISAESDFEAAEREVRQRASASANGEPIDISATFSLKIISDTDKYISPEQLANAMLSASDEDLTTAYGIYIDGEFVAAVRDKEKVQDALSDNLMNYQAEGVVRDVSYVNKVEYNEGIYVTDTIMSEKDAINLLTSAKEKKAVYIVQAEDTPVKICQKFGMDIDTFEELNPAAKTKCRTGQMLNVIEHESYLPIQYIREMESLSFLDYETIEVETSSLNVGIKSILVKGERGEKLSNVEVTYVDGIERSRKVLSSKVTKEPVIEQVGIGVYSARPDSPATVITGSGEFSWPVNGGWISDVFISDRNHKGLDIAADMGTEIYAAGDGIVLSAGWNSGGYGNVVMIDHLNGYQTVYGHMSRVVAVEGQYVTRGQLIGLVGSTGDSTGPHCHFEVRYEGVCYNPESYLNTTNLWTDDELKKLGY